MSVLADGKSSTSAAWTRATDESSYRVVFNGWHVQGPAAFTVGAARSASLRPFDERPAPWLHLVADRINDLIATHHVHFSSSALRGALELLSDPIWSGAPKPLIGSLDDGGIALEFRGVSAELQIEFESSGVASAYVSLGTQFEWEGPLSELPDGVDKWAWRLAQSQS